jgi:hypothetical protein
LNLNLFCELEGEGKERKTRRKQMEMKDKCTTKKLSSQLSPLSLYLSHFPPNLEGKENFEAAFLSAHFHAIYKVSYFVYSKQNILLTPKKKV